MVKWDQPQITSGVTTGTFTYSNINLQLVNSPSPGLILDVTSFVGSGSWQKDPPTSTLLQTLYPNPVLNYADLGGYIEALTASGTPQQILFSQPISGPIYVLISGIDNYSYFDFSNNPDLTIVNFAGPIYNGNQFMVQNGMVIQPAPTYYNDATQGIYLLGQANNILYVEFDTINPVSSINLVAVLINTSVAGNYDAITLIIPGQ